MFSTRRMNLLLIFTAVLFAVFAGTAVTAQTCDSYPPTTCAFVDVNGVPSVWSLALSPGSPAKVACASDAAKDCYKWTYLLTGDPSGINQAVTLAPSCCPEVSYSAAQVIGLGAGDPTTGFGAGNFQNYVVRLAPSATSTGMTYSFTSDKLMPGRRTTVQIKAGKNLYYCRDIKGPACPGCPPDITIPINITECKNLEGIPVKVERNFSTWCAEHVYQCDIGDVHCTGNCLELTPMSSTIDGQHFIQCTTGDGNQRCPECIVFSASSPGCYTYSSGGRTYKICTP